MNSPLDYGWSWDVPYYRDDATWSLAMHTGGDGSRFARVLPPLA